MKRRPSLQPSAAAVQEPTGDTHIVRESAPVFLTAEEAADRAQFTKTAQHPVRAFYAWAKKVDLPTCQGRGRVFLVETRVLDAYIRGERWTLRRRGAA